MLGEKECMIGLGGFPRRKRTDNKEFHDTHRGDAAWAQAPWCGFLSLSELCAVDHLGKLLLATVWRDCLLLSNSQVLNVEPRISNFELTLI